MTTPSPSFIEELLADQRSVTAVERFSRAHDERAFGEHARAYRDLIPLEAPKPGEQYAFEVELDKCSGCKACVTACHSLNGLDEHETWRDVGLLVSAPSKPWKKIPAIQQTVTTACHHCVEPGCLEGCPVLAYEKDSVTGIVRHLDDQCIGCQYCVLKCPYDVPKYNSRLGIVRKCDMCSGRLAVGEAPACVQACPNEAIRITKVSKSEVTIQFRERGETFLTGAPDGNYTLPTTIYRSADRRVCALSTDTLLADSAVRAPTLLAADAAELKPQPAHWPLVLMLVLSQASVGVSTVAGMQDAVNLPMLLLALALALAGLGTSVFHLGRPLGAWRAFLNLKRSWMSREIVVFGVYVTLLAASATIPLAHHEHRGRATLSSASRATHLNIETAVANAERRAEDSVALPAWVAQTTSVAFVGLLGVFCSAMIYHDTRRPLWHWRRSLPLFFGSTIILGAAGAAMLGSSSALLATIALATVAKLGVEVLTLRHRTDRTFTPMKKTALLVTGHFQHAAFARIVCAFAGGVGLPILLMANVFGAFHAIAAALMFALLLTGELIERLLFFTTVVAPKMPGNVST